ncbi:MAG: hypothetical protein E7672_05305, partial [Ruminococcaceae bacterium]|nr:hypothetical protein [Oscillospiraceae bacterium]
MKKFVSLFLAVIMVALMLPVGSLAAEPDFTLYHDGTIGKTKNLTTEYSDVLADKTITMWVSGDPAIASVTAGVVTGLKTGTTTITAVGKVTENQEYFEHAWTVTVQARTPQSIAIVPKTGVDSKYYAGDELSKSDFTVTLTYDNGDTRPLLASEYALTPAGPLSAGNQTVTATYSTLSPATCALNVKALTVKSIAITNVSSYTFEVGDSLPTITAKVTYDNNETSTMTSGFAVYVGNSAVSSSYKFQLSDNSKTIKVSFGGKTSGESSAITVSPKETETETDPPAAVPEYTFNIGTTKPNKTVYKVGEKFDPTGISIYYVKNGGTPVQATEIVYWTQHEFKSTSETSATFSVYVKVDTGDLKQTNITVTGLTVGAATVDLDPKSITSIYMDEDSYVIGHKLVLDDITYVKIKNQSNKTVTVYASSFSNYTEEITLEVLKT